MMKRTDWVRTFCLLVLAVVMLSVASAGCGRRQSEEPEPDAEERFSFDAKGVKGMTLASQLEPEYAEGFRIYYYKEGFRVIDVKGSASYLVVPQGKEVPGSLPEGMVVLKKPLDRIYVAGTATMAMFNALGGLDQVGFSSLKAEDWYVEAAREEYGHIHFLGRLGDYRYYDMDKAVARVFSVTEAL